MPSIALSATSSYFSKSLPFAENSGWFGKIFLSYGFLAYVAVIIALVCAYVLEAHPGGPSLKSCGREPRNRRRSGHQRDEIQIHGYLCGLYDRRSWRPVYYVMDYASGVWSNDAFGDRGWLAIALVIFTIWRPVVSIFASIFFGGLYILYLYIPTGMDHMEFQELYKMIPYVVTLVVLVLTSMRNKRENQPPNSLGQSYFREER